MAGLSARIARHPAVHDPDRAASALSGLSDTLTRGGTGALIAGAAGSSPYLARLIQRHGAWLGDNVTEDPDAVLTGLLRDMDAAAAPDATLASVRSALRRGKSRAALLIALADLGGVWPLGQVTAALTALADTACEAAARYLLHQELGAGRLSKAAEGPDHLIGYFVLAMGKMGAHELNYSSDIDLIALFDDARFAEDQVLEARARFIHVTRQLVKLLSENTDEGYVFRTDLRLRPSPSTTPVCLARDAAERYYESVGRTWERAAHIKARPLVDRAAGQAYLQALTPFVWRRHLDFAAIDDIHGMLRKIREKRAQFSPHALPGYNIKLDPGGIREIEFFAQTRQLIMGGRQPGLRQPGTLGALAALADAGIISGQVRDLLTRDYTTLRTIEHRLQMMEDAQTHAIPTSPDGLARLAALCGTDPEALQHELSECLARVHSTTEEFFGSDRGAAPPAPPSAVDLSVFERPDDAARHLDRWHGGQIAATRSDRARQLFQSLAPRIVALLAEAANPDQALAQFDRFLSSLPAGVQVFSLFSANPKLLELIVSICAAAPRLSVYLGRHAQTLDALLDRDFWEPVPDLDALISDLSQRLAGQDDYETILDICRRWARELGFRIGVHVIRGVAGASEAGGAYTRIAQTCVQALLPHVTADFAKRHGPPPGPGLAVLAMGRMGSAEMTAGSDLDLITIYDTGGQAQSQGPRPLPAKAYYTRLTQALISALTAPTAEGVLYEVDMRLRPSGNQGPLAVGLGTFRTYQMQKAWVWEHMALTRARVIAGPEKLAGKIQQIITQALSTRAGQDQVLHEAAAMRARLIEAAGANRTRPWALKHTAGGLMEIEFLAQTGVLWNGLTDCRSAATALPQLSRLGWLDQSDADALAQALTFQQTLQQIERVAQDRDMDPEQAGDAFVRVLTQATGCTSRSELDARLRDLQARAAQICEKRLAVAG